jgi:hypothetical protein
MRAISALGQFQESPAAFNSSIAFTKFSSNISFGICLKPYLCPLTFLSFM